MSPSCNGEIMTLLEEGNNLFSKLVGLICGKKDLGQVLDSQENGANILHEEAVGPLEDNEDLLDKHLSGRTKVQLILPWGRIWII